MRPVERFGVIERFGGCRQKKAEQLASGDLACNIDQFASSQFAASRELLGQVVRVGDDN
jgi:hypothetical protein